MTNAREHCAVDADPEIPAGELDVAGYINSLFPDEDSLAVGVEPFLNRLRESLASIDSELLSLVRSEQSMSRQCDLKVESSLDAIAGLSTSLAEVKDSAACAERAATEALAPASPFSVAVSNIEASIAAFDAFIALNDGIVLLEEAARCASLEMIAADISLFSRMTNAINLLEATDCDQNSPKRGAARVSELGKRVKRARDTLRETIISEFRLLSDVVTLSGTSSSSDSAKLSDAINRLRTACAVASAAGSDVQGEVTGYHLRGRLLSFRAAFQMDKSGISGIDKRYAWIRRELRSNWARLGGESEDRAWGLIFPIEWDMPWRIAHALLQEVRVWASETLKAGADRDVIAMVGALSCSKEFELELDKRFAQFRSDGAIKRAEGISGADCHSRFTGSLSACFGPFMGSYVAQEDEHLRAIFIDLLRGETWTCKDGDVLRSSTDLFLAIKKSMHMCSSLDTGQPLYSLYKVFQKHLASYATELFRRMPSAKSRRKFTDVGSLTNATDVVAARLQQSKGSMSSVEFSKRMDTACAVISTAEYCALTVEQLEVSLRQTIDSAYKGEIDLNGEREKFATASAKAVRAVAEVVAADLLLVLDCAGYQKWAEWTGVGDSSEYIHEAGRKLHYIMPLLGSKLSKPHLRFFFERFVAALIPEYSKILRGCQRMNALGAQQVLLDASALKEYLQSVPSLAHAPMPATYAKYVSREMSAIESILKIVLTPNEESVNAYIALVPEGSGEDLQTILDMKGMSRAEAAPLILDYTRRAGRGRGLRPPATEQIGPGMLNSTTLSGESTVARPAKQLSSRHTSVEQTSASTTTEMGVESVKALFRGLGSSWGSLKDAKIADRLGQTADRINESLESTAEQMKRRFGSS